MVHLKFKFDWVSCIVLANSSRPAWVWPNTSCGQCVSHWPMWDERRSVVVHAIRGHRKIWVMGWVCITTLTAVYLSLILNVGLRSKMASKDSCVWKVTGLGAWFWKEKRFVLAVMTEDKQSLVTGGSKMRTAWDGWTPLRLVVQCSSSLSHHKFPPHDREL